jgi:putative SOS response-associated peptidase YedK
MCGRYTIGHPETLAARFGFVDFHETRIPPHFNVAPSQVVPVIVEGPNGRALRLMRWGCQPTWMRQPKQPPPINARAETLLERPLFREAVARGRCLIPADGFYEWAARPGQKTKQPVYVRLKSGELFGFAGLYTSAPDGDLTCAIVTTAANDFIRPIHRRMPVILERDAEAVWLDPSLVDPAAALACLQPVSPEALEAYPVGPLVSSAHDDGPELIRPASAVQSTMPMRPESAEGAGEEGDRPPRE